MNNETLTLLPHPERYRLANGKGRQAAVMLIMTPEHILLIERSKKTPQHGGQIALPGGKWETDDQSLWHTARRETWEEVAIDIGDQHPYSALPATATGTGFDIHPFFVKLDYLPKMVPDNREVQQILTYPTSRFLNLESYQMSQTERGYVETDWQGHHIWGATARILYLAAHVVIQENKKK